MEQRHVVPVLGKVRNSDEIRQAMNRLVGFWNEGCAELLQRKLEEKGIRVEQLAETVGVTARTVRNWMRTETPPTRPYVTNLSDLCAAAGVSADEFRAAAERFQRRRVPWPRWWFFAGAVGMLALAAIGIFVWRVPAGPEYAFDIPPEVTDVYDNAFGGEVSPDGKNIAFVARSTADQKRRLFIHSVRDRSTRALQGSEGNYTSFFWDHDGASLLFITNTDLMKVSIATGASEFVAKASEGFKGAVSAKGDIVLGSLRGLLRVTRTGAPELLTRVDAGEVAHTLPCFLPDGDRVLFTITSEAHGGRVSRTLAMVSLRDGVMRRLFPISSRAQFVNGQLLYARKGVLYARPFDAEDLEFTGPEAALASPVWLNALVAEAGFSASPSTLVVTPPQRIPPLLLIFEDGKIVDTIADPERIEFIRLARNKKELALITVSQDGEGARVWLNPLDGRPRVRLAIEPDPSSPVFAPDDDTLYYASSGNSWANIYAMGLRPPSSRRAVQLSRSVLAPRDISPAGNVLMFQWWKGRDGNLSTMSLTDRVEPQPFVVTEDDEGETARFSPDGKHVLFVARRDGVYSPFLADFPPGREAPRRLSEGDGWRARWSADGSRVFFVRRASVMEVDLSTGKERRLFEMPRDIFLFEPAPEGRFYVREVAFASSRTVVTSWWPRLSRDPLEVAK